MAKTKTSISVAPATKPLQPVPAISPEDARALDASINRQIKACNDALIRTYLDLADSLHRMKNTKGYKALGVEKWEDYLASKHDFSRGYLAFLLKVGQAGIEHFQGYIEKNLSPSKLIEYAKATSYPEKIPQVIEATWEEVKDKSVRDTRKALAEYVAEHTKDLKKPKSGRRGRLPKPWVDKIATIYANVPERERDAFKKAVRAWLKSAE